MSQMDLAIASKISRPTISRIERGVHNPRRATLERLAAALDVPVDHLRQPADEISRKIHRLVEKILTEIGETLEISRNPEIIAAVRKSEKEIAAGEIVYCKQTDAEHIAEGERVWHEMTVGPTEPPRIPLNDPVLITSNEQLTTLFGMPTMIKLTPAMIGDSTRDEMAAGALELRRRCAERFRMQGQELIELLAGASFQYFPDALPIADKQFRSDARTGGPIWEALDAPVSLGAYCPPEPHGGTGPGGTCTSCGTGPVL